MEQTITFKLEDFEGPLDLLLDLVSKNKMNIYNIEIVALIDQYVSMVNGLPVYQMESASEFIEMAARLVQMKSYFLLPKSEEAELVKDVLEDDELSQEEKAQVLSAVSQDVLRALNQITTRGEDARVAEAGQHECGGPIRVFGHDTDHIAFAGEGVVAVLDLPDPRVLARELRLETAIDTPQKVLAGKEARATVLDGPDGSPGWVETAVITASNVDSHPGQTLAGCSYSLDAPEPAEPAEPAAAPATTAAPSPRGAQPR